MSKKSGISIDTPLSESSKKNKPHSTTLYRRTRHNPNNEHEEMDYRKAVEVAARQVEGYRLSKSTNKKTREVKIYLEGKVSKVHERMEEQWLRSMGLLDKSGFVDKAKLAQLIENDEAMRAQLIEEEDRKNDRVKPQVARMTA